MKKKCAICHKSDKSNQMFQDGYYPDIWMHLKCLNSDKAKRWRATRRSEDPDYDRYSSLNSVVVKVCNHCGQENSLCVKATQPIWEVNCNQCSRVNLNALDPYIESDRDLYKKLQDMKELFLHDSSESAMTRVQKTMELMASQYDNFGKCRCGGIYSISAEPRCAQCNEIILNSYFHYVAPVNEDL